MVNSSEVVVPAPLNKRMGKTISTLSSPTQRRSSACVKAAVSIAAP
jgi:hypothetical protein